MILYAVILNEVKNLEVSVAVDGSASLEILRCTQDDITRGCFDFAQHDILREIATSLTALAMTKQSAILNAILCHSERSEESPQSRPATTHIDSA